MRRSHLLTVDALHPPVRADLGLWGVTFPIATARIAAWFRRQERAESMAGAEADEGLPP